MDYFEERKKKIELTSSKEYFDWLVNFTNIHKSWSDDSFLYNDKINKNDKYNSEILSYFFSYVESLREKQKISFDDVKCSEMFEEDIMYISLDSNFYELSLLVGQGAITTIKLLDKIPDKYIIIGRDLTEEEIKSNELVEIIIINKDYYENNSQIKIYNDLLDLSYKFTKKFSNTSYYRYWIKNRNREFYLTTKEELRNYKNNDIFIKDDISDIINIVSLGIVSRKNLDNNIKNLIKIKEE